MGAVRLELLVDLIQRPLSEQVVYNGSLLTVGKGEQAVSVARNPRGLGGAPAVIPNRAR